jgi:hypothetical protein
MRLMGRQRRRMRFGGWWGTLVLAILVLSATPTLGVLDSDLGNTLSSPGFCGITDDDDDGSDAPMPAAIGVSFSVCPDAGGLASAAFSTLCISGGAPYFVSVLRC